MTCDAELEYANSPSLAVVTTPPPTSATPPEPELFKPHPGDALRAESNSTRLAGKKAQITSKDAGNSDPHNSERTISERLHLALYLENSGSVARDHLALERTFLAYMRTSLLLTSTGVGA